MIVEDNQNSFRYLTEILKPYNINILRTNNGIDAVKICRQHNDLDMVLMDIQLPGMDGYQATKEIRKYNKKLIIIDQTAYALKGEKEKCISIGCNDYLAKPIDKQKLLDKMHVYLTISDPMISSNN